MANSATTPKFRGTFAHADLHRMLYDGIITTTEFVLVQVIDSLVESGGEGCWASNAYLAKCVKVKPFWCRRMITKLKKLGLIKHVGWHKHGGTRLRLLETKWSRIEVNHPLVEQPPTQNHPLVKQRVHPLVKQHQLTCKEQIDDVLLPDGSGTRSIDSFCEHTDTFIDGQAKRKIGKFSVEGLTVPADEVKHVLSGFDVEDRAAATRLYETLRPFGKVNSPRRHTAAQIIPYWARQYKEHKDLEIHGGADNVAAVLDFYLSQYKGRHREKWFPDVQSMEGFFVKFGSIIKDRDSQEYDAKPKSRSRYADDDVIN